MGCRILGGYLNFENGLRIIVDFERDFVWEGLEIDVRKAG